MTETVKNQRDTRQRREVLEEVMRRCDHPTADEIYLSLHATDPKISKGTVYRNLNILSANEEITHVRVPGADRYDSRLENHYHMICMSCGRVVDAPIEYDSGFDREAAAGTGFKVNRHRMVFEGICSLCGQEREELK